MRVLPKPDRIALDALHRTGGLGDAFPRLLRRRSRLLRQARRTRLGFGIVQIGIATATLAALAMIVLSAWLAWRQWGFGTQDPPHDDPTARDRTLFQGFATLLLSGLSFVAVLYVALPLLFIDGCAT